MSKDNDIKIVLDKTGLAFYDANGNLLNFYPSQSTPVTRQYFRIPSGTWWVRSTPVYPSETNKITTKVAHLMQSKYKNGLIDYTDVLQAEQNRLQAQMQMIKSSGSLYANLIRFYKAVGGHMDSE